MRRRILKLSYQLAFETASSAAVVLSMSLLGFSQQQSSAVARSSASRVQVSPRSGNSPHASAPRTETNVKLPQGNVDGYIFWDASVVQYKLSTPCQGLQVSVVDMTDNQTLATSSNLSAVWSTPQVNLTGGNQGPWMVCGYSFHQLPAKETLEVRAAITQASAFTPQVVVKQAPGSYGTDFVLGTGLCNQTPQQTLSAILGAFAVICGPNAFNVNLELFALPAPARGAIPSSIKLSPAAHTGQQPAPGMLLSQSSAGSPSNSTTRSPNTTGGSLLAPQSGQQPPMFGGAKAVGGSQAQTLPSQQSPGLPVVQSALVSPSISQLHSSLCSIAKCVFGLPTVQSLDSASVVSPGGKVVLQGANFNSSDGNPGQIVLKIGTKFPMMIVQLGVPINAVYHQPYVERQLAVLGWADSHVFGQIPADITGVMDGPATLEIWRSDGSKSARLNVHFIAARDLQVLPMSDVAVKSCAKTADANRCDQSTDSSQLSIPSHVSGSTTFSIFGEHVMFIQSQTQDYSSLGYDTYSFDLKNGWVLDNSYGLENGITENQSCKGDFADEHFANSKPSSKPSTSDVSIPWTVGCDVQYAVALHITGPKGVPWK
jgi:hypothetical protein